MNRHLLSASFVSLLCCPFQQSVSAELIPFQAYNLNPFIQLYGIAPPTIPLQRAPGELHVSLQQDISNSFSIERREAEVSVVDGELWRTSLRLGYGMTENWHLGVELPFVRHSDGFLDSTISNWHDWFSLPNGDREDRPEDALLYFYRTENNRVTRLQDSSQGLGDIQLALTHATTAFNRDAFLTFSVKLPTGEAEDFTGSGSTDVSVTGLIRDSDTLADWNLVLFGGGGLSRLGSADLPLEQAQKQWVWMTRVGGGWNATDSLQIKAQFDHHTAVYNSDIRALGSQALQLTAGISWIMAPSMQLDLAFSEDLVTTVSPDVTFSAALHYGF